MDHYSPCHNPNNDDDFTSHLADFSKVLSSFSPTTPSTILSNFTLSTPNENEVNVCESLARTALSHSSDERILRIYNDGDEHQVTKGSRRSSKKNDGHTIEAENDFKVSGCEFGDFNVSPDPIALSEMVAQFAKIVEEEEKFVRLYQQYFKKDPSSTRKALEARGFEFTKAKMVSMLSSRALTEMTGPDYSSDTADIDDSNNIDEISVVMSICTQNTGKTGISESTKNTAARLLERLKNPNDNDVTISKELCSLSPAELSARYVEMHEKLISKEKKKSAKKKKEKKKKKSKTKKKKKEDLPNLNFVGVEEMGNLNHSVASGLEVNNASLDTKTLKPKSILKKTEDYFQDYQHFPVPSYQPCLLHEVMKQQPEGESSGVQAVGQQQVSRQRKEASGPSFGVQSLARNETDTAQVGDLNEFFEKSKKKSAWKNFFKV